MRRNSLFYKAKNNFIKTVCCLILFLLLLSTLSFSQVNGFSFGIYGGGVWGISNAMGEYENTKFKSSVTMSASIMYKFANSSSAFELSFGRTGMDLNEFETNFGTLNLNMVALSFRRIGLPSGGTGFMGHYGASLGLCSGSFKKGAFIKTLENAANATFDIYLNNNYLISVGGGFGYILNNNFSIHLDAQLLITQLATAWKISGQGENGVFLTDNFNPSHFQVVFGLRYWFSNNK